MLPLQLEPRFQNLVRVQTYCSVPGNNETVLMWARRGTGMVPTCLHFRACTERKRQVGEEEEDQVKSQSTASASASAPQVQEEEVSRRAAIYSASVALLLFYPQRQAAVLDLLVRNTGSWEEQAVDSAMLQLPLLLCSAQVVVLCTLTSTNQLYRLI